jgi:peptidoglycan/LPS O-acetylase OafA/YrhL
VAAVLLFHAQFTWARGGFLGVSAFFTLSGFLITSLVLRERSGHGRIDLRRFWSRRARRLLPAAFVALGGVLVYGVFAAADAQLATLRADVLSALAYVANWRFVFHHQSYAEIFNGTPSPVLHFWSLAIEEQFYVVFPLLAVACLALGKGSLKLFGAVLATLVVASVLLSIVLAAPASDFTRVYYGTDTRAAELLIGALLAIALARRQPTEGAVRASFAALGSGCFLVLLVLWSTVDRSEHWLYHGGFALHALLTSAVLLACLVPGPLAAFLSVGPLRGLGRVSYGVYLYHWPVYLWLSPERLPGLGRTGLFVLRVGVTLAVAAVSFRYVERPVRRGAAIAPAWTRVVAPVAVAALVLGAIAVHAASTANDVTFAAVLDGPTPVPRRLAAAADEPANAYHRAVHGRALRVLVVGDSVGQTLGRGFERWALRGQPVQVWNQAHSFCSLSRYAPRVSGIAKAGPQPSSCDDWQTRWRRDVHDYDPDVVVLLYTLWETVPREVPGASGYLPFDDPAYRRWQLGEYERAASVLSSNGARVVWLTAPCVHRTVFDAAQNSKANRVYAMLNADRIARIGRARPDVVRVVDLAGELCPNGRFGSSYRGVEHVRPDGSHFRDAGSEAVAGWLMGKILAH